MATDEPVARAGCAGGCLSVVLGAAVGLLVQGAVLKALQQAWTSCTGWPWPPTSDMVDSPRFFIVDFFGYWLLYSACLPVGLALGARLLRGRRRSARLLLGLASAAALIGGLAFGDIALHIGIRSVADPSRCPEGVPAWWPWR